VANRTAPSSAKSIAQIIAGLNVLIVLAGVVLAATPYARLQTTGDLLQPIFYSLTAALYSVFAVLIIARQPQHSVGWLFLIIGFFIALSSFGGWLTDLDAVDLPKSVNTLGGWAGNFLWVPAFLLPLTLVLQFFPDGKLPSRRWWPVAAVSVLSIIGFVASLAFHPYPWIEQDILATYNPFGIPGSENIWSAVLNVSAPLCLDGHPLSQI